MGGIRLFALRHRRIGKCECGYNPSYIDGGGFASLPQANAKGHDPSLIRCAFAEGKAPSYIDGEGVSTFARGICICLFACGEGQRGKAPS